MILAITAQSAIVMTDDVSVGFTVPFALACVLTIAMERAHSDGTEERLYTMADEVDEDNALLDDE